MKSTSKAHGLQYYAETTNESDGDTMPDADGESKLPVPVATMVRFVGPQENVEGWQGCVT